MEEINFSKDILKDLGYEIEEKLIKPDLPFVWYEIIKNGNKVTSLNIPSSITAYGETYKITSIAKKGFEFCKSLKSVTIPDSVTKIEDSAFRSCESLEKINIPNGVTEIGDYAFDNCSLKNISIPNSVKKIGRGAFTGCEFTNISIPNSVKEIGYDAFRFCRYLKSINFPKQIIILDIEKKLGNTYPGIPINLSNCESLESITIPENVTSIDDYAFENCKSLKSIIMPNHIDYIGKEAFKDCSSLENIILYNTDKNIEKKSCIQEYAFKGCKSLKHLTIPNGIKGIVFQALDDCYLESITISNGFTSLSGLYFDGCKSLKSLEVPNSVTKIIGEAFKGIDIVYYNGSASGSPWGAKEVVNNKFQYRKRLAEMNILLPPTPTTITSPQSFSKAVVETSTTINEVNRDKKLFRNLKFFTFNNDHEVNGDKTSFDIELTNVGNHLLQVITVIRRLTGFGLKEAKDLVESAPTIVKEGVSKEEAEKAKADLEAAGAIVTIK